MSTNQQQRQRRAPELALRLRKSAAILTRAACLIASDGTLHSGLNADIRARYFTMSSLIRRVSKELYPDARRKVSDGEPNEQAWAFAYALIPQDPIDKSPEVSDLIRAAQKLREWAAMEDALALHDQWQITEDAADLPEDAAASLRAAIASTPADHPDHEALMSSRFMRKGAA
jgi:hypothetical protein